MSKLGKRAVVACTAVVALVGSTLAFSSLAGGIGAGPSPSTDGDHAVGVEEQNHLDHRAHLAEMKQIATANGLEEAPGDGLCGDWFQFRTGTGLHCSPGPMTRDMFTERQLTPTPHPAADPSAAGDAFEYTPRVSCFSNGTDGKRVQMVYARRSNRPDQFVSTATEIKWWASDIEEIMLASAQQTDGSRRVRFVTDGLCSAKVLNVVVPNSVTTFDQLVAAMEAKGYSSPSRKYLIAWDDGDATGGFCGLGETWNDSTPGLSNRNESQPSAQFAAVENSCWTSSIAAHELMHTLGAVQDDAPNATSYGHCTDEYDVMCYVDGPGVVMDDVCPYEQEDLYDCRHDDYFSTKPSGYLANHWNTANSGWLDKTVIPVPPDAPRFITSTGGAESVTVGWQVPLFDGGSPILGYEVDVGTARKVVGAGTFTTTVTGIPDGSEAVGTVRAINVAGPGDWSYGISAMPSPPVTTRITTPDGETIADVAAGPSGSAYVARTDRIIRLDTNGTTTTVVQGPGSGEGTVPLATTVHPGALAVYGADLYWYDTVLHTVRRLRDGTVTTIAGNGTEGTAGNGGAATAAELRVHRMAIGPPPGGTGEPRVHLLDKVGHNVRTFTPGGTIASSAGVLGQPGFSGDGWTATEARLSSPNDITASANGWVYIADTGNNRIRSFTTGGKIYSDHGNGTTTLNSALVTNTMTPLPAPAAVDWSAEKGLMIEAGGVIRFWKSSDLIRLAGDPFTAGASDADGTIAMKISYRKTDTISAMAWTGSNLHVVTNGPNPSTSAPRSRLRTANHLLTQTVTAPSAFIAAPKATAGRSSATVTWVPPSNGGGALSSFTVTASPGGKTAYASGESLTKAVVTGLTPGTAYTFTVKACASGCATSAASNAVTPTATPPYLPFSSWSTFVDAHYLAVVGRAPRSDERSKAVGALTAGTTSKAAFIVSLRRSSENRDNVDPVARLYRAFLARTPDAEGLQFWIKRRRTGTWNLTRMADSFATSSEFTRKYGSLTNRQFVTRIYTDVLGRTADTAGVDYWTKKLDTRAKTRGGVMVGFSESTEYQRKQAVNTDIAAAYILILQRAPSTYDESTWRPRLQGGTDTYDDLVNVILDADEYLIRMSG